MSEKPKEPEITKRELLSFCQLANLDWQFVDLKFVREKEKSLILSKALNPNYFLRTKKDIYGEIIKIDKVKEWKNIEIYGRDEEGRIALRKKIGMTMELLEKGKKGNEEGKYLDEWKVIEGYDNYKLGKEMVESSRQGKEKEIESEKEELKKEINKMLEERGYEENKNPITNKKDTVFKGKIKINESSRVVEESTEDMKLVLRGQIPEKQMKEWSEGTLGWYYKDKLTDEERLNLERWSYLHIPEREIVEENMKENVERIEREVLVGRLLYAGEVLIAAMGGIKTNLSILNSTKKLETVSLVKEFTKKEKKKIISYLNGRGNIEEISKLKGDKLELAQKLKEQLVDKNITLKQFYKLPKEIGSEIEKLLKPTYYDIAKDVIKELISSEVKEKIGEELLETYIPLLCEISQKIELQTVDRIRFNDTGIRFLLLKKEEESVLALGTGDVENKYETKFAENLEKGFYDPIEMQMYISQLSYLCDKLIKGGSKKITMVGFGLNGSLCHIFKRLLEREEILDDATKKIDSPYEKLKELDKILETCVKLLINKKNI